MSNPRDFVRLDEGELKELGVNAGVVSTLNVVRARARGCHVELVEGPEPLPPASCCAVEIHQVVLNRLVNAIDEAGDPDTRLVVRLPREAQAAGLPPGASSGRVT